MHPTLREFFAHAHDALVASMRASGGLSSATKGSNRETELRRLLQAFLPPVVRVVPGDLIDSYGRSGGQFDALLVHQSAPVVARAPDDHAVVLAEGVVAALEVKSNLASQWSQVQEKWRKHLQIRRYEAPPKRGEAIPFVVLGLNGWASEQTLLEKVVELAREISDEERPMLFIATLDPPMLGYLEQQPNRAGAREYPAEDRGYLLAVLWSSLSEWSRALLYRQIPWEAYLLDPARPLIGGADIAAGETASQASGSEPR